MRQQQRTHAHTGRKSAKERAGTLYKKVVSEQNWSFSTLPHVCVCV